MQILKENYFFVWKIKAQARECLFEKLLLNNGDAAGGVTTSTTAVPTHQDIDAYLEQAQEAAEVRTQSLPHQKSLALIVSCVCLSFNFSSPSRISACTTPFRLNWSKTTYPNLGSLWYR